MHRRTAGAYSHADNRTRADCPQFSEAETEIANVLLVMGERSKWATSNPEDADHDSEVTVWRAQAGHRNGEEIIN